MPKPLGHLMKQRLDEKDCATFPYSIPQPNQGLGDQLDVAPDLSPPSWTKEEKAGVAFSP